MDFNEDFYLTRILFLIGTVIISYLFLTNYHNRHLPPGPWGLPVFGYLLFLGKYPERTFYKLQKKYGNVISLYMGNKLAVILGDYTSIQEAFLKTAVFNNRPEPNPTKLTPEDTGIGSASGDIWRIHKKMGLRIFHDYFNGPEGESKLQEEFRNLIEALEKLKPDPVALTRLLNMTFANITCCALLGRRFQYTDKKFILLCDTIYDFPKLIVVSGLRTLFPWTQYIPFIKNLVKHDRARATKKICDDIFGAEVKKHESADGNNCYVDAFLTERRRQKEKTRSLELFQERTLLDNLMELLAGGMDTSCVAMKWLFAFMITYPDIQKKLQAEIDDIIGRERLPSIDDRLRMPYTEAVIMEMHRFASIFPLGVSHSNSEDCKIFGYHIPKGSYILPNLWAVHHDSNLWKDPYEFKPQRFLKNGKVEKPAYFMPFSVGKRSCLGEGLAKTDIFLCTAFVFQKYTVQSLTKEPLDLEPDPDDFFRCPKNLAIRVVKRTAIQ